MHNTDASNLNLLRIGQRDKRLMDCSKIRERITYDMICGTNVYNPANKRSSGISIHTCNIDLWGWTRSKSITQILIIEQIHKPLYFFLREIQLRNTVITRHFSRSLRNLLYRWCSKDLTMIVINPSTFGEIKIWRKTYESVTLSLRVTWFPTMKTSDIILSFLDDHSSWFSKRMWS